MDSGASLATDTGTPRPAPRKRWLWVFAFVAGCGKKSAAPDLMVVRRSVDHGATFGPSIPLLGKKGELVHARVRPDGTVVAVSGAARAGAFEAARLAPDAKAVTHTASLQ